MFPRRVRKNLVSRGGKSGEPKLRAHVIVRMSPRGAFLVLFSFVALSSGFVRASTIQAHLFRTFVHSAAGRQVAFSPDGQFLATSSVDRTVKFWRIADGKLIRTLSHPEGVTSIAFSRDGRWLVSGSYDGMVRIWRVQDGSLTR